MTGIKILPNSYKQFVPLAFIIIFITCQSTAISASELDFASDAYLDGKDSRVGIVLCHGRGKHPRFLVVEPLRKGIHRRLGYHTLSIQMPTGIGIGWREHEAFFPAAYKKIAAAIKFLKNEKGVNRVYLMGHSMGSRMATSFLAESANADIAGFIGVGIRNGGGKPLDSNANLRSINIPVIDIYGDGGDGNDMWDASKRSDMANSRYQQVLITGANHTFSNHERELVDAVVEWLIQQQ